MAKRAKVGHANIDGNLRGARVLASRRRGLMAFGTSEMTRAMNDYDGIAGFEASFGGEGHPDRRALDTAVFRRKATTVHHGVMGMLTSEKSTPRKVAGLPRFVTGQLFFSGELEMNIGFWELHNHYIGKAHDQPGTDRVQKTDEGMRDLLVLLRAIEKIGYANIVVGDFNVPRNVSTPGWLSPWEMLARLDYQIVPGRAHPAKDLRIDGAGVSKRLAIEDVDVLSKSLLGSDHPGFVLTVAR